MALFNYLTLLMFISAVLGATTYSSVEEKSHSLTMASSIPSTAWELTSTPGPSPSVLAPSASVNFTTIVIPGKPWPTEGVTKQTSVQVNTTIVVPVITATSTLDLTNLTSTLTAVPSHSSSASAHSTSNGLVITSVFTSTAQISKTSSATATGSATASPSPVNAAVEGNRVGAVLLVGLALAMLGA